mmetsp:Transcript_2948/g.4140  ORF Transcript_2948/g.4140 Transcript_2948/m.4140 type:complete len:136 (-) Transcript_2948:114-521(-)|eukprot:CAMPEP_0194570658 /NCGR_PEP_ID=MMETSP0292-20121207/7895_1 /TAXON_ID=39354 /ORGANISM="Heterosigma akashiwo, Strain CCMP2393" /LENGTH=135 /DNA_ID=CAMNT_0039421171 /DNA_START=70 /DNA_END=477 /DNA_ORIENTATION=-
MTFTRFAEIGRVCLVNYGPDTGKLCTIIDILDHNKALVDAPAGSGLRRQLIPFKRLNLTDIKINIGRNSRKATLAKAYAAADVSGQWESSAWAKKIAAKAARANLNDFERFKVMVARKQKASIIKKKLGELKKSA